MDILLVWQHWPLPRIKRCVSPDKMCELTIADWMRSRRLDEGTHIVVALSAHTGVGARSVDAQRITGTQTLYGESTQIWTWKHKCIRTLKTFNLSKLSWLFITAYRPSKWAHLWPRSRLYSGSGCSPADLQRTGARLPQCWLHRKTWTESPFCLARRQVQRRPARCGPADCSRSAAPAAEGCTRYEALRMLNLFRKQKRLDNVLE